MAKSVRIKRRAKRSNRSSQVNNSVVEPTLISVRHNGGVFDVMVWRHHDLVKQFPPTLSAFKAYNYLYNALKKHNVYWTGWKLFNGKQHENVPDHAYQLVCDRFLPYNKYNQINKYNVKSKPVTPKLNDDDIWGHAEEE